MQSFIIAVLLAAAGAHAQDPMAGTAMEASAAINAANIKAASTPAAIKAAQFRTLRKELRAKRREKEQVKQKLLRVQDLERMHLLTKANIDAHQPKVAMRRDKSFLDAALVKLATDMSESTRQVGVIDGAIKNLKLDKAKNESRAVQIKRLDAALVIKIAQEKEEREKLAKLLKMESELKASVDNHRIDLNGELSAKVANGKALQDSIESQLGDTIQRKAFVVNKLNVEVKQAAFQAKEAEEAMRRAKLVKLGEKSQLAEIAPVERQLVAAEPAELTHAQAEFQEKQAHIDPDGPVPAPTASDDESQTKPAEAGLAEVDPEELEEAELSHAEVEDSVDKAMNPAPEALLEVKKWIHSFQAPTPFLAVKK